MSILLEVVPLLWYHNRPKAVLDAILESEESIDHSVGLSVRWSRGTIHKAHNPLSERFPQAYTFAPPGEGELALQQWLL